ncbi:MULTISPECIES: hypothetical protein [unclassified Streptomyces]|uniref:hypothetical protein n=1 Tax=unclassified Streptomyces TaxID=2593676 RepID=UPI0036E34588
MTVTVIVAVIAFGVVIIHLLNSQHGKGLSAVHYSRSGLPAPGPDSPVQRGAGASGTNRRHLGGRGRLRPRRRSRTAAG